MERGRKKAEKATENDVDEPTVTLRVKMGVVDFGMGRRYVVGEEFHVGVTEAERLLRVGTVVRVSR